jgi:hypothetical protein
MRCDGFDVPLDHDGLSSGALASMALASARRSGSDNRVLGANDARETVEDGSGYFEKYIAGGGRGLNPDIDRPVEQSGWPGIGSPSGREVEAEGAHGRYGAQRRATFGGEDRRRHHHHASICLMDDAENGTPGLRPWSLTSSSAAILRSDSAGRSDGPRSFLAIATSSGFFSAHVLRP